VTSCEIVKKTIHFEKPDRLPYSVWIDIPRFEEVQGSKAVKVINELIAGSKTDFILLDIRSDTRWKPDKNPPVLESLIGYFHDERIDEWQVSWKELRVVSHPLEKDLSSAEDYMAPDPSGPGRFEKAIETMKENKDKYHLGLVWFTLFERLWMLRGFNNMLIDPYANYREFSILRQKVMDFNMGLIEQWAKLGVDGIFVSDDWGGQEKMLVNPAYWVKFYKPCYKEMFELIHSKGLDVWMHSCGNVTELIPYLVELGLDVLNPLQPHSMDIDLLGKQYSGKLCFFGGVDIQDTLPHGTAEDISKEVRHLIDTFGQKNGGYIGGTSHTILPDTSIENVKALFKYLDLYCSSVGYGKT
jgi:uroporphyrinogen decarboxylase